MGTCLDAMKKMKEWIIDNALASSEELEEIQNKSKEMVRLSRNSAWEKCMAPILAQVSRAVSLMNELVSALPEKQDKLEPVIHHLSALREPNRRDVVHGIHQVLMLAGQHPATGSLQAFYGELNRENIRLYDTHLYHEGRKRIENIESVPARFANDAPC